MEAFKGSSISEQVAGSLTRNSAAALAGADSAGVRQHELQVVAADGYLIGATLFSSAQADVSPRATILIHGATAVPQSYYAAFARFAAQQGFRVVTYDYRGVGRSRPATLVGFQASMRDWAEYDARAVIAWAKELGEGRPLFSVGHSFGGQMLGLIGEAHEVDASVLVGAQLGYYGHWDLLGRAKLGVVWHWLIPGATRVFGFLPGQLGLGVDLPRGVAEEWARWCRSPEYFLGEIEGAARRLAAFSKPVRMYSFSDDDLAPRGAVRALREGLSGTRPVHVELSPAEVGAKQVGHFGFFRQRFQVSLWQDTVDYFNGVLSGQSPTLLAGHRAAIPPIQWADLMADLEFGRS